MSLRSSFLRDVKVAGLPHGPGPWQPVTDADLDPLPEPARQDWQVVDERVQFGAGRAVWDLEGR